MEEVIIRESEHFKEADTHNKYKGKHLIIIPEWIIELIKDERIR